MIGFVMVGTNDLDKAINYYDVLLESIDLKRAVANEKYAGYSSKERPEDIEFYVTNPANKEKATYGNGAQISFVVNSKEMVDKFYNLGIKLGGKDEGGPGIRPSSEYYCYLRDLDGNKICAFVKINN
jgi:catechol 2,3-dioxygenase-like lactoylglutathione lyase family enzyme